jgi:rod shape-determining protein MreC
MGNIFTILFRVFPFAVFIILEIISFYVISNYNDYYKSNIISRSNSIVGGFYAQISEYNNYFSLKDHNDRLVAENAGLKNDLFTAHSFLSSSNKDTAGNIRLPNQNGNFQVIPAKLINNSISNLRNYIILDKGKNDGVTIDMAAISDKGPIGIVIDVTDKYCCLMSFVNKDATISARVKSTQHVGQLKWGGGDTRLAILDEIPKHIKLKKGDEIITSGFSSYYPEGIPIGRVLEQKEDKLNNFANIKVAIYNDFSNLKYVYLLKNNSQAEIKEIEDKLKKQITNINE